MTTPSTREELIAAVAREIETATGAYEANEIAQKIAADGFLADPGQAAELERLQAELAVARTPHGASYVDPEHQGGNCVDVIMSLAAELNQARKNWDAARKANMTALTTIGVLKARLVAGLKLIDDQMALFGSVMPEDKAGLLRDIRAVLTGEVTLDD